MNEKREVWLPFIHPAVAATRAVEELRTEGDDRDQPVTSPTTRRRFAWRTRPAAVVRVRPEI